MYEHFHLLGYFFVKHFQTFYQTLNIKFEKEKNVDSLIRNEMKSWKVAGKDELFKINKMKMWKVARKATWKVAWKFAWKIAQKVEWIMPWKVAWIKLHEWSCMKKVTRKSCINQCILKYIAHQLNFLIS